MSATQEGTTRNIRKDAPPESVRDQKRVQQDETQLCGGCISRRDQRT
jgi:hypothetical protein